MNLKKLLLTTCIGVPLCAFSQVTFTNANSQLAETDITSGCAIGVADMNGDGLDDIIRLENARYLDIQYQNASGTFTRYYFGSLGGSQWGLAIADVDGNGYNDIITGGAYNGMKLIKANNDGTAYTRTNLSNSATFLQNVNFIDIDNNGTIDIFACDDVAVSKAYSNDGNGNMTLNNNGLINAESTIPSDDSGNYGSIWTDYDNDGDQDLYISKCRLGVNNQNDGRRVNLLFENDGFNNFSEVGVARGLVPFAQSWSANFEDIDNDGDLDAVVINHDMTSNIYENNGSGVFTDITASSGIASTLNSIGSGGIQVIMEDFDNDTFIDLFITSRYDTHYLFKNNGNKTFSVMPTPFTIPGSYGRNNIQSAAVGDLNNDGFIDVVAGFATGYNSYSSHDDILYLNNGNLNNWFEVTLEGNPSNINGIGARIELYGAWGKQIREVRSGESYGTMNSLMTHFGIGTETQITKVVVKWPSGNVDEINNPNINESIVIVEGQTLSASNFDASQISLYPNPTKGILTIETSNTSNNIAYQVYDIAGKLVTPKTIISGNTNQVNLSKLHSGVYFVHIEAGNKTSVHKIIKE